MVTLLLNPGGRGGWGVRMASFAAWALAAGLAVFWGLRLFSGGLSAPVPVPPSAAIALDAAGVARALGAGAVAPAAQAPMAPASSRYALRGLLAGRDSGGGAAVIAIGGQPAKPFRVGAAVEPGVVLQSVSLREARLGPSMDAPSTMVLSLPLPAR